MGSGRLRAGTVASAMADPLEPDAPDVADDAEATGGANAAPRRPALTARMIGICVCIALLFALVAGLITAKLTGDDRPTDQLSTLSAKINSRKLLSVPLRTVAGKETTFQASLHAKPVLVNLWSQSCIPCTNEMPLLEKIHTGDDRVDVVGVDTQDRIDLAKQMAKQTGITYPWFQDTTDDFLYEAKAVGLPHTVLLDPSGKVLATKTAQFHSVSEIRSWLTRYLP